MRKKSVKVLTIFVVLLHAFGFNFLYVEANEQPAVCNSPSELMSDYFWFQNKARAILLWSELNEKRFSTSFGSWRLFSNKILELHDDTAIDILAWSVWNLESIASNAITSAVLALLISASIIQSGTEWLIILFKDRPIVRDYKEMLDIESSIFDVAFFLSKQVNLTRPLESDLSSKFADLIKEYQAKWLLESGLPLKNGTSIASILIDLLEMNANMKHFIFWWGEYWKNALQWFNGCLWNVSSEDCQKSTAVIKFSGKAIEQLDEDYKDVRSFSSCNSYVNFFTSSINKTIDNNLDSVKVSIQDMKQALIRLKWAMLGNWRWNFKNNRQSLCEWISDYEMAQLKAYWWSDWTCWSRVNASTDVSSFLEIKEYFKNKKAQREQKQKMEGGLKKANNVWWDKNWMDIMNELDNKISTADKQATWFWMFGTGQYNTSFSRKLYSEFNVILDDTLNQYWQAQENAMAADVSALFPMWKWILDQVDTSIGKVDDLKKILEKIKNKQCSS